MLMPSANATAKYAVNGELFAQMTLSLDVSEDTAHGRLILQNVNSVLIAPHDGATDKEPEKVKNKPFYVANSSKFLPGFAAIYRKKTHVYIPPFFRHNSAQDFGLYSWVALSPLLY